MITRRVFPRRLTVRWFATRGWAFGAGVTFLACAVLFRPLSFTGDASWIMPILFANAALANFWLGFVPERLTVRLWAVGASVVVTLARGWTLIAESGGVDVGTRVATAAVWAFIAYACWLLATLTAKIPTRR